MVKFGILANSQEDKTRVRLDRVEYRTHFKKNCQNYSNKTKDKFYDLKVLKNI